MTDDPFTFALYAVGEPNHFTGKPTRYHALLFERVPGRPTRRHDLLTHASESTARAYAAQYIAALRRVRGARGQTAERRAA